MTVKITELLQVLADRGLSDDAIVNVRDGLLAQAQETFMSDVLSELTDEELQVVEAATSQDEANQKLLALYHEKTGKDMQEEMQKIVDQFADNLIAKYKIENTEPLAPVVSEGTDGSESTSDVVSAAAPSAEEKPVEEETVHDLT